LIFLEKIKKRQQNIILFRRRRRRNTCDTPSFKDNIENQDENIGISPVMYHTGRIGVGFANFNPQVSTGKIISNRLNQQIVANN
jgi:hypothetical protein